MTTISLSRPSSATSCAAENLPDAVPLARSTHAACPASHCADQTEREAPAQSVGAQLNGSHVGRGLHTTGAVVELLYCAAFLDDVERLRIATENRLRSLQAEGLDATIYLHQAQALEQLEHQATLSLQRAVRLHPLGPWIKRTVGVGEKQGARLIAAIGDIAYNHAAHVNCCVDGTCDQPDGRPRRGPAELWAYCGFVPGQRRRKGVKSNWNAQAKMRAFLVAESCLKHKAKSPYGPLYDAAKAKWSDRETSDAHKHAHALRVVAKAVLRDLFLEARRVGA